MQEELIGKRILWFSHLVIFEWRRFSTRRRFAVSHPPRVEILQRTAVVFRVRISRMAPSRNSSNFINIRVEEIRRAGWFPTAIDIPMAARATLIHLAGQTGRSICGGIGNASISRSKHRSAVNDTQWLGDDKETAVPLIANSGCALAGSDDPACLKMALSLGAARCVRNAEPPPSEKSKGVVTG